MTGVRLPSGQGKMSFERVVASFADVVRLVRRVLPDGLIDDRGWKRLAVRAERLPSTAADAMFGFECRLDDPEESADLLLSVPCGAPFAEALVHDDRIANPKEEALARFLSELQQPGSRLGAAVDLVALEYDVAGMNDFPAPGVFFRSIAKTGFTDPGLLAFAAALAAGWSDDMFEPRRIERIFNALPRGAAVRWSGVFPDRKERAVRLLIRALKNSCASFLSRMAWRGNPATDNPVDSRRIPARRSCPGWPGAEIRRLSTGLSRRSAQGV